MDAIHTLSFRIQLLELCNSMIARTAERRQRRSEFIIKFEDLIERHEQIVSKKCSRLGLRQHSLCKYIHRKNILPNIDYNIEETVNGNDPPVSVMSEDSTDQIQNIVISRKSSRVLNKACESYNSDSERVKTEKKRVVSGKTSVKSGKSRVLFARSASRQSYATDGRISRNSKFSKRNSSVSIDNIEENIIDENILEQTEGEAETLPKVTFTSEEVNTKKQTPVEKVRRMSIQEIGTYLNDTALRLFKESVKYNKYFYATKERTTFNTEKSFVEKCSPTPRHAVRQTLPRLAVARKQIINTLERESTSMYSTSRTSSFQKVHRSLRM